MIERTARLRIALQGAALVGGHTSPSGWLDAATARDAEGVPLIPASAVKGALREACTRLARGNDLPACLPDEPDERCGDGSCVACRLFGAPGPDVTDVLGGATQTTASWSALFVSDARIVDAAARSRARSRFDARYGVGIDRARRSVVPEVLYQREVIDDPDAVFEATLSARCGDNDWSLVESALNLMRGVGNSRTRGLGHVTVTLIDGGATTAGHVLPETAPADGLAVFEVECLEPLVLGDLPPTSMFNKTLEVLRGSALRGAIGHAAARLGVDSRFQRAIVDPATCVSFSDAWPTTSLKDLPVPVPRSSLVCKHRERADHRQKKPDPQLPVDGMLSLWLAGRLAAERGGSVPGRHCPHCREALQRATGVSPKCDLPTRVVTRLARDLERGAAHVGKLYAVERIEPKAASSFRFVGTVANLDAEALALLTALRDVPLRVGRGRSRGQGRIRLTIKAAHPALEAANIAARRRMSAEGMRGFEALLPSDGGGSWRAVAVLARTDIALSDDDVGEATLPRCVARGLFGDASSELRCLATSQLVKSRSGWDDGAGSRPAGS